MEATDHPEREQPSPNFLMLASLGLTLAVAVGGLTGLGIWLDIATKMSPLFSFLGLLLGIVSAVAIAVKRIKPYF